MIVRPHRAIAGAFVFLAIEVCLSSGTRADAADALTICLEDNAGLNSFKQGEVRGGFDLAVAGAIAKRLGRTLVVQWYEIPSKAENYDTPANLQKDALLSDGKCKLIGGFPLAAEELSKTAAQSRLPDFDGAKPDDDQRLVTLGDMTPTAPYHFIPLTVVLAPKVTDRQISSLGDLAGMRIGGEEGTLAGTILNLYRHQALAHDVTEFKPHVDLSHGGGLFDRLERGEIDATLVVLSRFDAYRKAHPDTKIKGSGFYHSIGFNIGFAGLVTETPLIDDVSRTIKAMRTSGELLSLARAQGVTYVAPREPEIRRNISLGELSGD